MTADSPTVARLARRGLAVLAAALTIALAGCVQDAPTGPDTPTGPDASAVIGLTYIPNIQFAPFYLADAGGYFTDQARVTLRHHGAAEGLFTALTTGDENFVVAGGDEILQARAQDIDVVAVASYYAQHPARLIVPTESPIRTMADLAGHSVGLPGRYGETWFALLIALRQAGLTEADVTITEIGFTQQAALTTGDVDAVMGFANSDVPAFAEAGVAVRAIDPGVPLVSICLATSQAYAQAHPDMVDLVVDAMRRGMRSALDDPEAALTTAGDYIPSFRGAAVDTARQVLGATTALFVGADGQVSPPLDPAQWQAMAQAMAQVGLIPQGTDPTTAYLVVG
jgi:NitT/TauT family transport system substrate-binding protein